MKHFTYKWLRRFYVLIAIKLVIFAVFLTSLRILFVWFEDYKEDLASWVASEYNVNLSASDISAGVDFAGIVFTFNNIKLQESDDLPVVMTVDYFFLHLDLWDSVVEQKFAFNRISLKGVDLTFHKFPETGNDTQQTLPIISSLETVFLQQLNKFSIKDSRIHFKDHFNRHKTIIIENLNWFNNGDIHQGVGSASLPDSFGNNSLDFVVNVFGEQANADDPLRGELYIDADNLNISDYLIAHVNDNAKIENAVLGFQVWAKFAFSQLQQVQVVLKDSRLTWRELKEQHDFLLNSGLLQLTNSENGWLLDSYDLDVVHNRKKLKGLRVIGSGGNEAASLDFKGALLRDFLPIYALNSKLTKSQVTLLQALQIDAHIKHLALAKNKDHQLQFAAKITKFKNRAQGAIPGLSDAQIELQGDLSQGQLAIKLAPQKIYFDGQFSRSMPIKSADIAVHWADTATGFKLFSEQAVLKTTDLDSVTDFSLLFPKSTAKSQSPFLSLYSYASLNDASKAKYYYPIKAMGRGVFDYLQPTLKKGEVKGAKILWYGAFNEYPYRQKSGVFQAWVPLRNAQYDFYGKWQGLTNLDLNLLFENDNLTMEAIQASLGEVNVDKLSAHIDYLRPDGILTINADVNEDAQKISRYLKKSPLKESVGKALTVVSVKNNVSGKLQLSIPFDRNKQKTKTTGKIILSDNNIDIAIAEDTYLPLKKVHGQVDFINGNLSAKNIKAKLFSQNVQFAFAGVENKKSYKINAQAGSTWDLKKLSKTLPQFGALTLSGNLDWSGVLNFEQRLSGGYKSRIALTSATQGVTSKLPFPFYKNALQSWPTKIVISSDQKSSTATVNIKDKLDFIGNLDYQNKEKFIPYFALNIGADRLSDVATDQHNVNVVLEKLNIEDWYQQWLAFTAQDKPVEQHSLFTKVPLDHVLFDINYATLFEQPLVALKLRAVSEQQKWSADIDSDKLKGSVEYRTGIPERFDFDIKKLDFQSLDLSSLNVLKEPAKEQPISLSDNLQEEYPEIFAQCVSCIYGDYDFSPFKLHLYPSKNRFNIDYINIGTETEFTNLSGIWDQRRTNIIVDSLANRDNSLVKRLGYRSPVVFQKAQSSGAFNWIGAPWEFNVKSLNGALSAALENGSITEVSDKGARLLSLFSLDSIRRSLNVEFNNVFDKGLNFDELTLSANINNGVIKNEDFYFVGSAGKIIGTGLIDLSHYDTNYQFSYSPAVTSSLPVLTAFAINPLTGAAFLLLTKLIEPVIDTIIRVDYSVKGPLNNPVVEIINRQKGTVKLQNSELLEEINKSQKKIQSSAENGL